MATRIYRLRAVPAPDAYVFALSQPFVGSDQRRMLIANRHAPQATIGTKEMARQAGVPGYNTVNLRYGVLGHKIADLLDIHVDKYDVTSPAPLWTTVLAEGVEETGRPWLWRMYPEVCAAIDQLGWGVP